MTSTQKSYFKPHLFGAYPHPQKITLSLIISFTVFPSISFDSIFCAFPLFALTYLFVNCFFHPFFVLNSKQYNREEGIQYFDYFFGLFVHCVLTSVAFLPNSVVHLSREGRNIDMSNKMFTVPVVS